MDRIKFELLKNKLEDGPIEIRIVSDSMLPLIKVGDTISMFKKPTKLKAFDIIVFFDVDKLVCHFIWKDQKDFNGSIITRSLKEPYKNEVPRNYKDIIGIVSSKKISSTTRIKILFFNFLRGTL